VLEDLSLRVRPASGRFGDARRVAALGSAPDKLTVPLGPQPKGEIEWHSPSSSSTKTARPADPPTLHTAVPNWRSGDTIPFGPGRTLRVIEIGSGEGADVLVVESA
jgi:hypothetical protein